MYDNLKNTGQKEVSAEKLRHAERWYDEQERSATNIDKKIVVMAAFTLSLLVYIYSLTHDNLRATLAAEKNPEYVIYLIKTAISLGTLKMHAMILCIISLYYYGLAFISLSITEINPTNIKVSKSAGVIKYNNYLTRRYIDSYKTNQENLKNEKHLNMLFGLWCSIGALIFTIIASYLDLNYASIYGSYGQWLMSELASCMEGWF